MKSINDRSQDIVSFVSQTDGAIVICRCEEITKGEIRQAVHDDMFTISEVRRYLRPGMGLCLGQTCSKLVKGIVARELDVIPALLDPASSRSPMCPVEMKVLGNEEMTYVQAIRCYHHWRRHYR